MTSLPEQEAHVREILARSHVSDWDALRRTACYRADECRLDETCPFAGGCRTIADNLTTAGSHG